MSSALALPELPVTEALPRLAEALRAGSNAVLVAPPGAGKTTLVPLVLRDEPWAGGQKILVLEPRRVAARAAARRMASLLGEELGQTVGLVTRLERATSAATRIEVITEGLLVRRLQSDPGLEGVAAVLFDEAHERNLDTDLALAFCLDLQRALRPELRLLAMSATLEAEGFSTLLGDAPVVESLGRAFPVAVQYRQRELKDARELPEAMASAIREALRAHPGDVLAFLPGWGEIRRTADRLGGLDADVLPLHGEMPPAEQDRALNPGPRRKVVLATSIAETSLTVPGVRIVVDGGFRRAPRLDPATGLSRLATLRISRAAAEQRAGRAGRTESGVAIRLWTEALHRGLPLSDRPEILESELSGLALDCAAWGAEPDALPFLDPPPAGTLAAARALLRDLDALDAEGRVTATGRRMARLGTHPRLARMMTAAESAEEAALAAELAALLEERDPIRGREAPSDIQLRLDLLHGADDPNVDRAALGRIRRAVTLHRRRLGVPGGTEAAGDPGLLLAAGFPDRIAAKRGVMDGAFRLASGQGARLPPTDKLAKAPLLAVADLELAGTEARIRMAAPLERAVLESRFPERLVREEGAAFDARAGAVVARRRLRFGPLVLEEATLAHADPAAVAVELARAAAGRGFRDLDWSEAAKQTRARLGWMHRLAPGEWPDVSDAALAADGGAWLAPWLSGLTKLSELKGLEATGILRSLVPHARARALDAALPPRLDLPRGRSAAIDYTGEVPRLEARAQWLFGLATLPPLAQGRIPLQVALLSPAGRPVAVTADLPGFWRGAWADVRKEMRGRYPKHDWPEDPSRPI
ncbi:ATP-dependent helicase HrpB [Roseomonas marmotae]|uniref:RNA helicase n=1 Tax=Roseomonas marmotae TaxID=2768161 RepID=A0ABS3KEK0_9PROT|nr:ATP-dependent helicase HrpB [Roseomonas marmotae]MBO1075093.1 ATP-dependent helicase HrpB [Roseomonas marmotae]QTI79790.1 ATP-dependent helicase HrpB [Roseomonas marmotae]